MTDGDVMKRLLSIQPMPRGERMAKYIDNPGDLKLGYNPLWEHLFDESRTLNALDNLFARNGVYLVSLRTHAARWRAYAAPLRRARERLRYARACSGGCQVTGDVMDRLMAVQPMPRGERMARWMDSNASIVPFSREWNATLPRRYPNTYWFIRNSCIIFHVAEEGFKRADLLGMLGDLDPEASLWRQYAAPLRKARDRLRRCHAHHKCAMI